MFSHQQIGLPLDAVRKPTSSKDTFHHPPEMVKPSAFDKFEHRALSTILAVARTWATQSAGFIPNPSLPHSLPPFQRKPVQAKNKCYSPFFTRSHLRTRQVARGTRSCPSPPPPPLRSRPSWQPPPHTPAPPPPNP